jgi:hypothetical protein
MKPKSNYFDEVAVRVPYIDKAKSARQINFAEVVPAPLRIGSIRRVTEPLAQARVLEYLQDFTHVAADIGGVQVEACFRPDVEGKQQGASGIFAEPSNL